MATLITPNELPKWVPGKILCNSEDLGWNGVELRSYHYKGLDVAVPAMRDFMIVSYQRGATFMERRFEGAWTKTQCTPGDLSLLTRSQQSHWHWTEDIDVCHVYLSEKLVSGVANEIMDRSVADVRLKDILNTQDSVVTAAVNTITREGKRLVGHNTDVPGFKQALDKLVGRQKMPRQAVVFGAGGGSRAVIHGLITAGFLRIIVFNRHLHRAEGLVKFFGKSAAHMELKAMPWHESIIESELSRTRVLVNATSIGLHGDESPIPGEIIPPDLLVLDLIYRRTKLLRDATSNGSTGADGATMLLHQGAAAFSLWTGQPAPLEVMEAALTAARAEGIESAEGEPTGAAADA